MDGSGLSRAIGEAVTAIVIVAVIVGIALGVGGTWACGKVRQYRIHVEKVEGK